MRMCLSTLQKWSQSVRMCLSTLQRWSQFVRMCLSILQRCVCEDVSVHTAEVNREGVSIHKCFEPFFYQFGLVDISKVYK